MVPPRLSSLDEKTANNSIEFSGLQGSALSYALARVYRQSQRSLLIIMPTHKEALALAEELGFFLGEDKDIHIFPPLGILPYYGLSPNVEAVARRMAFLEQMRHRKEAWIGILSISALMRRLPDPVLWDQHSEYLVVGEEVDREALLKKMIDAGYLNAPLVEDPGTFSRRGGILDLYSPQGPYPVRLEFFGDQLESMRTFDPESQRSLDEIEEVMILPAREVLFSEEYRKRALHRFRERANEKGLASEIREPFLESLKNEMMPPALETYLPLFYPELRDVFAYLPSQFTGVWMEPELGKEHYEEIMTEVGFGYQSCESPEKVISPEDLFLTWGQIEKGLEKTFLWKGRLLQTDSSTHVFKTEGHEDLSVRLRHAPLGEGMLEPLVDRMGQWVERGYKIGLVASSHSQGLRMEDLLVRKGLSVQKSSKGFPEFFHQEQKARRKVFLIEGHLAKGFVWPEEGLALLTDQEIFGEKKRRRPVGRRTAEAFTTFEELGEGDFVVHEEHGLGIYHGLKSLDLDGQKNDFLLLEYLGGDKLYVPVYRLNQVSRYTSAEGQAPRLDRMGSGAWEKSKAKVRRDLKAMANELLKLYAARATLPGYGFSSGGALYEEFEATFPFEETPDQLKAIEEVNEDMDENRPMDRLVCGDVGFGKTEVAMRAAFRAILDNKQVAILVPTTVLALQHERTFRQRFQQYPAVIGALSRFSTPKAQRETLERLKAGKIDIIIGTHALLSKRVQFKDLGLLVIDEEHRFGVSQKEKIKKLRQQADVLTLTATPIPRTLNMSLSGIRDLSVIATPPVDRLAIQTLVANYNEGLIKEAVHRELARGGQVYVVHNRVQTIGKLKRRLAELLPEAKIEMGHGQMSERDLEEVMIRFLNREFNVFLCTTIVESGLDVPSANTMIINRADLMGLAQLYQLRGRIGRSNRRAYAYLLTPSQEIMTRKARSRLSVLQRYTELGSGFKIASHDLEIRGAGNLLGAEQSGHIAAMGYELYMRLLEEAVAEVKGTDFQKAPDPELQLKMAAFIPEEYMPETPMRLTLYKRFASAVDEEELDALGEETRDRFGELPKEVKNLMALMRVKLWAKRAWVSSIRINPRQVVITFDPDSPLEVESLMEMLKKEPDRFRWLKPHELAMGFKEGKQGKAIESLLQFLMRIKIAEH